MERCAVLRLAHSWIWDFWFADDGRSFHVFFLKASRSLSDPELRHFNAAIGHATSEDLIGWTVAAECDPRWYELLGPGRDEAWRDPWVLPDPGGDG